MLLGTNENEYNYWIKSFGVSFSENKILSNLGGELLFRVGMLILFETFYYKDIDDEDKKLIDQFLKSLKGKNIWKYSEFLMEMLFRLPMTK